MLTKHDGKNRLRISLRMLPSVLVYYKTKRASRRNPATTRIATIKYQWSDLNQQEKQQGVQKIASLMEKECPHLDPNISLASLATRLAIPAKDLSQILNECYGQNFCGFINRHRIEVAKRLLIEENKKRIIDIQLDAGFNSKSTFNTAFRQATGLTPSAFRQKAKSLFS